MKKKVSVIMPLYNAERFVAESLVSVLNQTMNDIEIICLDDCSSDNTVNIVKQFCLFDSRIKLIESDKKVGPAVLRNQGIELAKGEYLSFLDGDDIFEPCMIERAYECAEDNNLDIALYQYKHFPSERIYEKESIPFSPWFRNKFCEASFSCDSLKPYDTLRFQGGMTYMMIRKNLIMRNNIRFQDIDCCNDTFFGVLSLYLAKKILFVNDERVFYYARDHFEENRLSRHRNPFNYYYALKEIEEYLINNGMIDSYVNNFFYFVKKILSAVLVLDKCSFDEKENCIIFLREEGLRSLITKAGKSYEKVDGAIREDLSDFIEYGQCDFSISMYYVREFFDEISKNIIQTHDQNKKVVLWGMGEQGNRIKTLFEKKGVVVDYLVDKKKKSIGNDKIWKIEELNLGEIGLIVTSSKKVYEEISDKYENVIHYFQSFEY